MIIDIEKPIYAFKGTEEIGLVEIIDLINQIVRVEGREFKLTEITLFHDLDEL